MGMSYSNPSGMTAEEREQAREDARQEDRQEGLQENRGASQSYQHANEAFGTETPFIDYSLNGLKGMLASTSADGIQGVGENWKRVHDQLVGPDGSGSGDCAYGQLKKAVDNVLEHWEGESANQFRNQANKILQDMFNTATHCDTVSTATKQAADDLRAQKAKVDALEEPNWFERAGDRLTDMGRDDAFTQEQIANKDLPKDVLADLEEDYLSEGMEVKLQAVNMMETLGRSYVQYQKRIRPGDHDDGGNKDIPPSNPAIPMPTPIPPFSGSSPTPGTSGGRKGWSTTPTTGNRLTPVTTGPRDVGISGGKQVPVTQTKIDSMPTGITGAGADTIPGGGSARGTGPGGGVSGPGTTGGTGGGMLGATPGGRGGTAGGARSGIRGSTPGGTAGRGGATGGFRGMGGMGGGAGGGGRGAAGGGRGPLARAKGGVAGAAKGITGGRPATPGGTGLGRGRGGASGNGNGARGGMLAGRMGSTQRPGDDEREQGDRPDYLVEDEETWTPEDNRSVPRTIE